MITVATDVKSNVKVFIKHSYNSSKGARCKCKDSPEAGSLAEPQQYHTRYRNQPLQELFMTSEYNLRKIN